MTAPKIGGTKHKWLTEDLQAGLRDVARQHVALLAALERGDLTGAALTLTAATLQLSEVRHTAAQLYGLVLRGEQARNNGEDTEQ